MVSDRLCVKENTFYDVFCLAHYLDLNHWSLMVARKNVTGKENKVVPKIKMLERR